MESVGKAGPRAPRPSGGACILLRRGSADDPVWPLEEDIAGAFLTIGASPECEWQVRALGVPAHALSVLWIGGLLHVRSGPERGVRMNGALLGDDWTHVEPDALLDIGLATLEFKLDPGAALPSQTAREPARHEPAPRSEPAARLTTSESERPRLRQMSVPEHAAQRMRSAAPRAGRPTQSQRTGERRRRARRATGRVWLYLLGGIALAGAYVAFVVWLD